MDDDQLQTDAGWVPLVEAPFRLQFGSGYSGGEYRGTTNSFQYAAGFINVREVANRAFYTLHIWCEDVNGSPGASFLVGLGEYLGIDRDRSITEFAEEKNRITPERTRQAIEKALREAVREGRICLKARESLNGDFIRVSSYGLPRLKFTNQSWHEGWAEYTTGQQLFDLQVAITAGSSSQVKPDNSDDARLPRTEPAVKAQPRPRKRGRPKGTGLAGPDAPLLQEMRHLIESGQASSPTKAAKAIAHKAEGSSLEAIIARLRGRYNRENKGE